MYIIAIGWLYVTTLMAFAETNVVAGVMTFLFYGLFPVALLLFLLGTPARRQRKARETSEVASTVVVDQLPDQPDRQDARRDQ